MARREVATGGGDRSFLSPRACSRRLAAAQACLRHPRGVAMPRARSSPRPAATAQQRKRPRPPPGDGVTRRRSPRRRRRWRRRTASATATGSVADGRRAARLALLASHTSNRWTAGRGAATRGGVPPLWACAAAAAAPAPGARRGVIIICPPADPPCRGPFSVGGRDHARARGVGLVAAAAAAAGGGAPAGGPRRGPREGGVAVVCSSPRATTAVTQSGRVSCSARREAARRARARVRVAAGREGAVALPPHARGAAAAHHSLKPSLGCQTCRQPPRPRAGTRRVADATRAAAPAPTRRHRDARRAAYVRPAALWRRPIRFSHRWVAAAPEAVRARATLPPARGSADAGGGGACALRVHTQYSNPGVLGAGFLPGPPSHASAAAARRPSQHCNVDRPPGHPLPGGAQAGVPRGRVRAGTAQREAWQGTPGPSRGGRGAVGVHATRPLRRSG